MIDVAVIWLGSGTNSANVELFSDASGLPGTVIRTFNLSNLPSYGATTIQASQTISGIGGILLTGGTQYWLAVLPGDSTSALDWNDSDVGGGTNAVSTDGGSTWEPGFGTVQAFDVLGTPVPVPETSSLSLLGTGILGLMGIGLYKKRLA